MGRTAQNDGCELALARSRTDSGHALQAELASALADILGVDAGEFEQAFAPPPPKMNADLALPCQRFAKTLRRNPAEIAAELADAARQRPPPAPT